MMKRRLAIITSHPIQYNVPLFALIAQEPNIELMVFYTWGEQAMGAKYDPDFGKNIEWDIPLLDGYYYTFVINTSSDPGSHHFKGIMNPTLNQEIEAWEPNAIWVWGWAFDSHLKVIRHFKGKIPIWFRGDSTLLDESKGFSLKKIVRRMFLTWVYRHVNKAFYVGTHNKSYYKMHGLKEYQLVYAPHAIDNNRFSDESGEKTTRAMAWRKDLGFKETDIVVLFAGKLEPKKNPKFMLELSKQISSPSIIFLLVGNGILEAELKSDARNDHRFVFLDFQNQSQMPIIYRVADFFILPSLGPGETWGLAINEALVSGTKVLASEYCGGAIDLINDHNGLFFNPKTELNKARKYIIENHDLLKAPMNQKASLINDHSYQDIINALNSEIKA
jgi:glycosyltransferase involved in cell wall biosynthesis